MSHGWLSLIEVSGPFLAEPVLKEAFPQGLEGLDPAKMRTVRQAYEEWRDSLDNGDPDFSKIHRAWIELILKQILELDENDSAEVLKSRDLIPEQIKFEAQEHGVTMRPDYAIVDGQTDDRPLMLIGVCDADVPLAERLKGNSWSASPGERMVELCRAVGTRLGLVTNGEQWMFVDAPSGAAATFASWYARLWGQEPATLQAFVTLLGVRRFFVDRSEQLPALLDKSLEHQDEVTDALGEQVRRAVEVLVQALDRADVDRNRELLDGITTAELYEAGLTVMMRIVFLLSAEERGLLLLGDERYEANYAVSTLRLQLRSESEEILERRWDAWSRLLSIFRAVYGGVEHDAMRLPALGGSLFDPDKFPFLEGRPKGSRWKIDPATPLPIDNRTVLYLLDAVQLFEGRTLSYLALDVEQIGYVYEGLLERTVVRAGEVTLDLDSTKNAKNPWVTLSELDDAAAKGTPAIEALLKERTGSSGSRVHNDFAAVVSDTSADKLLTVCHGNRALRDRIRPYFHFLRTDRWGYPLVYPKGTFMVRSGTDRRETGTHYTPKTFTETMVRATLEPLVYIGPAEGKPRDEWKLRSSVNIIELKICDPAMGSGAFLVQVCRWLSERIVEAWTEAESLGKAVTSDGEVVDEIGTMEPLRKDAEERQLVARRLVAERCLYGVDLNPLAVELAKLSLWLVTLAKGRPFGFLDHNLRSGDSLLGVTRLEQLNYLDMNPGVGSAKKLFASDIDRAIAEAIDLRSELRRRPIRDIRDVEVMAQLDEQARRKVKLPQLIADLLVGEALKAGSGNVDTISLGIEVGRAIGGDQSKVRELADQAREGLAADSASTNRPRQPFHWPLEFPEVFCRANAGFDAFVGNPPFLGGQMISGAFGSSYREYLARYLSVDKAATADLVVFFFLRVFGLVRSGGHWGLLARRSLAEGKNREVGLEQLIKHGVIVHSANTTIPWPGKASIVVHQIHCTKGLWNGAILLNGVGVETITSYLDDLDLGSPMKLAENKDKLFQGTILNGEGFKLTEQVATSLLQRSANAREIIFPFIGGNEVNSDAFLRPACWVINFWDWAEDKAALHDAFSIVEEHVKPERTRRKPNGQYQLRRPLPERWWQHGEKRPALYHAIGRGHLFANHPKGWNRKQPKMQRVIAISRGVTKYPAFTFLENKYVFSEKLYVLADERNSVFGVLSSDVHAIWAWAQKTSMADNLSSMSYTHGNIFETFPFPEGLLTGEIESLSTAGKTFYEARNTYMEAHKKGLTRVYNDFHNASLESEDINTLRSLQINLNEAVLRAYGIEDIDLELGFHNVGYLPTGSNVRFTVSEDARLALLRHLSKLNKIRAANTTSRTQSKSAGSEESTSQEELFASDAIKHD